MNIEQFWFETSSGKSLYEFEKAEIEAVIADMRGYYLLQLGRYLPLKSHLTSSIDQSICAIPSYQKEQPLASEVTLKQVALVAAHAIQLPFKPDSIDVVLAPHVVEFTQDLKQLLAEAWRVLLPQGYLVLTGFNPYSLWGLTYKYAKQSLWPGNLVKFSKVCKLLLQSSFELAQFKTFYFRPHLSQPKSLQRLRFLEIFGPLCLPYCGAVYLLLAKKRVVGMTPIKPSWRSERKSIRGVVQPTTRGGV